MEITLRKLCELHDLTCISVTFQKKYGSVTVYLHWDSALSCASGTDGSFDAAFAVAVQEMHGLRAPEHGEEAA